MIICTGGPQQVAQTVCDVNAVAALLLVHQSQYNVLQY